MVEGDIDTGDSGVAGTEVTAGVEVTAGTEVTARGKVTVGREVTAGVDVWAGAVTVFRVPEGTESGTETGFFSNMVDRIWDIKEWTMRNMKMRV